MYRLKQILSALAWNIFVFCYNIVHHRDENVILIGAWMGVKFADNSRFLFQYLHHNKETLGIKKVVWVTRNADVNKMLVEMGYESFLIGSPESTFWHLRSGVHVVCNAVNDIPNFHADIDTKLSFGAKKIQLWHGVGGIKAVGNASNLAKKNNHKDNLIRKMMRKPFFENLLSQGGWREAHILSSGVNCANALIAYTGCRSDRIFVSGYPRNCKCDLLLDKEREMLDHIAQYNGCVLFLPTFRSDSSHYVHPLSNKKIRDYLVEKNILWIEKPHTADINQDAVYGESNNVCNLDSSFDVNTIYNAVSCVITDYSSVAFDAVFHKKPLIIYAPDIEEFRHGDVGFIIDFESYFKDELSVNLPEMIKLLIEAFDSSGDYIQKRVDSYMRINEYGFDNRAIGCGQIWTDIKNLG